MSSSSHTNFSNVTDESKVQKEIEKQDDEEDVRPPLTLKDLPTLDSLEALYNTLSTDQLKARLEFLKKDSENIQRNIVELKFQDMTVTPTKNKHNFFGKVDTSPYTRRDGVPPPPSTPRRLWAKAKAEELYFGKPASDAQNSPSKPGQAPSNLERK